MLEEERHQEYLCPGIPKWPQTLETSTSLGNGNSADLLTPLPYLKPGDRPCPPLQKIVPSYGKCGGESAVWRSPGLPVKRKDAQGPVISEHLHG